MISAQAQSLVQGPPHLIIGMVLAKTISLGLAIIQGL